MSGMRKCEACGGPGPCLYDDGERRIRPVKHWHRYVCKNCHSNPSDPFFQEKPDKNDSTFHPIVNPGGVNVDAFGGSDYP